VEKLERFVEFKPQTPLREIIRPTAKINFARRIFIEVHNGYAKKEIPNRHKDKHKQSVVELETTEMAKESKN